MTRVFIFCILLAFISPSCAPQKASGSSVVVKPKNHNRYYVKGKDRYKKRTKLVRMKN